MVHTKKQLKYPTIGLITNDDLLQNLRESDLEDNTTNGRKLQPEIKLEEASQVMDLLVDKPEVIDRLGLYKLVFDGIGVLSCKEEENKDIFSLQKCD